MRVEQIEMELTNETLVHTLLLQSQLLLPSLVILNRPLPDLVPLEILSRLLSICLLPQGLCETLVLLEMSEFPRGGLVLLMFRNEILSVGGGGSVLMKGKERKEGKGGRRRERSAMNARAKNTLFARKKRESWTDHLEPELLELLLPLLERSRLLSSGGVVGHSALDELLRNLENLLRLPLPLPNRTTDLLPNLLRTRDLGLSKLLDGIHRLLSRLEHGFDGESWNLDVGELLDLVDDSSYERLDSLHGSLDSLDESLYCCFEKGGFQKI